MSQNIQDYYQQATETPWGRLFYELVFHQLSIPPTSNVLDFGSGFGITASHYGNDTQLTAIEPNQDMLKLRMTGNYQQLTGGETLLKQLPEESFDWIICHNVLEYTHHQEELLSSLLSLLKPGGRLSLVKHHLSGGVIQQAVLMDQPQEALAFLSHTDRSKESYFGVIHFYEEKQLANWCLSNKAKIVERFGIRSLFGLSQNHDIKHSPKWYQGMLALEKAIAQKEPFLEMAFYHHIIIEKHDDR